MSAQGPSSPPQTRSDSGSTARGRKAFYESKLLIAGLSVLLLGAGNWLMGSLKFSQYQEIVEEGIERGFKPRPPGSGSVTNVLRLDSEEGERYNIARARVDLYHVVLSGGRLMVVLGLLLTASGWIRLRWRKPAKRCSGNDAGRIGALG